ncbi:hypothetical protein AN958_03178 [Leucoagaricus sp. SymC.cos]|nr:hypothetical protein AN958_03178 [Leucoagaricus sp. SymC.cos]
MSYECLDCDRTFSSVGAVQSHARAKGHSIPECEQCDRIFVNENALDNTDLFTLENIHLANSPAHQFNYESESEDTFSSASDEETYCYSCSRSFVSNGALVDHLASNTRHNWCFVCSRDFSSPNALSQHNASAAHRGKTFKCPFCDGLFGAPSAIAQHIESGCHQINRHQVTAAVHRLNIVPQISISRRIEDAKNPPTRLITYSANECAWNGRAYECYLCHASFKTLDRLNQHLNSPAHDALEFKCPHCKSEFQLVSGLTQHIESESCGIARFREVARNFEKLTQRFSRLLTF